MPPKGKTRYMVRFFTMPTATGTNYGSGGWGFKSLRARQSLSPRFFKRAQHVLRAERQPSHAHAGRVVDGVRDAGKRRHAGNFAGAFGAVRSGARIAGHERGFDARHHVDRGHEIIDERRVHCPAVLVEDDLLAQRLADTHRRRSFDLSFDRRAMDRKADVVYGDIL